MCFKAVVKRTGHKEAALLHTRVWLPGQPEPQKCQGERNVPEETPSACVSFLLPLPSCPTEKCQPLKAAALRALSSEAGGRNPAPGHGEGPGDFSKLLQLGAWRVHRSLGALGFLWLLMSPPGAGDHGLIGRLPGTTDPRGAALLAQFPAPSAP